MRLQLTVVHLIFIQDLSRLFFKLVFPEVYSNNEPTDQPPQSLYVYTVQL